MRLLGLLIQGARISSAVEVADTWQVVQRGILQTADQGRNQVRRSCNYRRLVQRLDVCCSEGSHYKAIGAVQERTVGVGRCYAVSQEVRTLAVDLDILPACSGTSWFRFAQS